MIGQWSSINYIKTTDFSVTSWDGNLFDLFYEGDQMMFSYSNNDYKVPCIETALGSCYTTYDDIGWGNEPIWYIYSNREDKIF